MFTIDNINARLARLLQVAALSFCIAVPQVVSAQRHDNADALQITIMRQQREIDSLRAELSRYSSSVSSNWDLLSGIEPDDETMYTISRNGGAFSDDSNRELMVEILAACPSLGSIPYNTAIQKQILLFTETRRKTMSFALGRYSSYLPVFKSIFDKYGIPEDIIALVIVESAVSPKAVSRVGAAGIWQLMPETAKKYGLRVDDVIDERFDPIPSCDAAARYLKSAYKRFGDWSLAVASYNCGPASVSRAMQRAGKGADIWSVLDGLPAETRNYYPAFIAARYAVVFSDLLDIPERTVHRPELYRVSLSIGMTMEELSKRCGIDIDYLKSINPHILGKFIPGGSSLVYLTKEGYKKINNN